MTTRVVIHNAPMRRLARDEDGPVGRYLSRKALGVDARARTHLAGHRRSGALETLLRYAGLFQGAEGMYALVGTDATPKDQGRTKGNVNFAYPVALETGRDPLTGTRRKYGPFPFLEPALREEFGQRSG